MEETNPMILMPCSSPVRKNAKKFDFDFLGTQSFVTMTPVLTGYLKTLNQMPLIGEAKKVEKEKIVKNWALGEENLKSAEHERKEIILINKQFCSNFNQYRLMRELEELDS